tara:strand:+ start:972 stop:1574 length:603 start_codon:yes stop_codon:yes gene_type:complete
MFGNLKNNQFVLQGSVLIKFFFVLCAAPMGLKSSDKQMMIVNFGVPANSVEWMVVNDSVMGGVSSSQVSINKEGYMLFKGNVSLDYGGGFASVRSSYEDWGIGNFAGFVIKVWGDGKTYQFRCRMGNNFEGLSYRRYFETNNENWQEIHLPFSEFVPTYRGRIVSDAKPLEPQDIRNLGLMISDKQSGNFSLKIAWIGVY